MPVIYDGVGGAKGDLFNGLKLWISRRVPQRSRWVDLVEGNGGEVVQLEKKADMLIADNIKRGGAAPPPGSYTWQWIEFSVKNHFLQPTDDYLITTAEPRSVGSSAPAKATRTPYTAHDDSILTKFVLAKEATGHSTQGTEIFKQFGQEHPHHPWQSWRERWVKHLSNRPRPNLPDEPPQPKLEASAPAPVSAHQPKARGRNLFTKEEDSLLRQYIRESQERNKTATGNGVRRLSGNKLYQEFAEQHPSHTWHAWRDRWLRHLSRSDDEEGDAADPQGEQAADHAYEEPQQGVNGQTAEPRSLATSESTNTSNGHAGVSGAKTVPTSASDPMLTTKGPNPKSDAGRLGKHYAHFETLVVPFQSLVRGYLVRMRETNKMKMIQAAEAKDQLLQDDADEDEDQQYEDAAENLEHGDLGPEKADTDARGSRDQFYDDLQDYIDVSGAEVDRQPVVDGRKIDLWDLFKAATQQECDLGKRNWKEIAEELGFDWFRSAGCLPKLCECYTRNLAEFEEAIRSYDGWEDEDNEDEEEEEQQPRTEAASAGEEILSQTSEVITSSKKLSQAPSSHAYRSSPPITGVKRSFRHTDVLLSDLSYPSESSRKRRRLDQRSEIPLTPENKLGLTEGLANRSGAYDKSSPLKSRGTAAAQLTEVDSSGNAERLLDGDIEDVEGIDELPELPHPPKKRFVEPETQDFGFALNGNYGYETDGDDVSPSQQLQTESDIAHKTGPPSSSIQESASTTDRPSLAAPVSRASRRPASSIPKTVAINATRPLWAPSGSLNGKPTKRSLPQAYQKQSASAPVRPSGSAPIQNGITQSRPVLNPSLPGRPVGVPPRFTGSATSRARHATPSTTTPAMLSSPTPLQPASRRFPSSTAPPLPQNERSGPKSVHPSNFDNDPAVIDAQFAHFQALGYEKAHIGRALEAATFQRGPMTVALQSLHEGRGLPQKEPGVWTDDDDEKLKAVQDYDQRREKGKSAPGSGEDERERARIERYRAKLRAKHGEWMGLRLRFMDMMEQGTHV